MDWKFETAGPTGECRAFGVNIFKYPWRDCNEKPWSLTPTTARKRRSGFMKWRLTASLTALPAGSSQTACSGCICL